MKKSKTENRKYPLKGFIDTHVHTGPDVRPRLLNDVKAALDALEENMGAIVLKSHVESTAGRARLARETTGMNVFGGVTLNQSVGGLNPAAVHVSAEMGGKIVWFPTISHDEIHWDHERIEEILQIVKQRDLVLGTGHLNPFEIFDLLDMAHDMGISKILVNHPFTAVVGASLDQQKEMSRYAYLEHCYVACMEKHDNLDPGVIVHGIKEIGSDRCIMATDFGQAHNPRPVNGMNMFVLKMMDFGISHEAIETMCIRNPLKLFS